MKIHFILLFMLTVLSSLVLQAGTAEVSFIEPNKFKDIDSGEMNKKAFRKSVLKAMNKHFNRLAEKLPENQKLIIKITDLDLAGSTHHASHNRIRIVKEIYAPRMDFSYQLIGPESNVISEDEVKLKNSTFMSGSGQMRHRKESFSYEKHMIDKWFKQFIKSLATGVSNK